jgi:hypothetical protein
MQTALDIVVQDDIPYYFKYKMPSNLRHIQFLIVGFRKRNQKGAHSLNLRLTSIFQWKNLCKICIIHLKKHGTDLCGRDALFTISAKMSNMLNTNL